MPQASLIQALIVVVVSYVIGSIPTAYIIGRLRNIDIFEVGSGNMGATNIVRATGKITWGVLVWFFDSTKGIIAILLAHRIMPDNIAGATVIAATASIVGHNWSLFVGIITGTLRGGKGAATAFGTLVVIIPLHVIAGMLVLFGIVIAVTRYVSLAVLLMFGMGVLAMLILTMQNTIASEYAVYSLAVTFLIVVRFRDNIQRLLDGTERRLGERV